MTENGPQKNRAALTTDLETLRQHVTELEESEQLFRATFAALPDPALLWKRLPDGAIVLDQINPAALAMSQGKLKDFIGTPVETFFDHIPECAAHIQHTFETGEAQRIELLTRLRTLAENRWVTADYARVSSQYLLNTIRDITERVQAEQLRRENERRLQTLLSNLPGMAYRCYNEPGWPMAFLSQGCQTLTGYAPEALISAEQLRYGDIIHPDDRQMVWQRVQAAVAEGRAFEIEYRIITKTGVQKWVWEQGLAVETTPEDTTYLEGLISDITPLKQSQQALRFEKERAQQYLEVAEVILLALDTAGKIIIINPKGCQILGYTADELTGRNWFETCVPAEIRTEIKTVFNQIITGTIQSVEYYENPVRCKDGSQRMIAWHNSVLQNEAGEITGIFSSGEDITRRLQFEKKLRESEARYRSLFERMPIGLYRTTPQGEILDANPALVKMLGYADLETLLATDASDIYVNPEARKAAQAHWENAHTVYTSEQQLRRGDGENIWVQDTIQVVRDAEGRVLYYEGSLEDITQRKEAARQLQAYSEQLEEMVAERTQALRAAQEQLLRQERLAALGQLAGSVAHELRNPLSVIHNGIYYLKMAYPDAPDKTHETLQLIGEETQNASKIIADLLEFGRSKPARRAPVEIAELVAAVMAKNPAPEHISINVEQPEQPPTVLVDAQQIKQVLTNLISNAYQAMPEGGRLDIKFCAQQPDAPASEQQYLLTIQDTGTGIPPEHMPKLFEPLFTTKPRGIGLGLALSKNLIERNDGHIEVESTVGAGSTFRVYLPVAESEASSNKPRIEIRD